MRGIWWHSHKLTHRSRQNSPCAMCPCVHVFCGQNAKMTHMFARFPHTFPCHAARCICIWRGWTFTYYQKVLALSSQIETLKKRVSWTTIWNDYYSRSAVCTGNQHDDDSQWKAPTTSKQPWSEIGQHNSFGIIMLFLLLSRSIVPHSRCANDRKVESFQKCLSKSFISEWNAGMMLMLMRRLCVHMAYGIYIYCTIL